MELSSECFITIMHGPPSRPPHFHAIYGNTEALIDIRTLEYVEGKLPKRARTLVIEWAIEHRGELLSNWEKARKPEDLSPIEPLNRFRNMAEIERLEVLENYCIYFRFTDGLEKIIDFKPYIKDNPITKPLADLTYFRQVRLCEMGSGIYWPNGYDFDPTYLRDYVEGEILVKA